MTKEFDYNTSAYEYDFYGFDELEEGTGINENDMISTYSEFWESQIEVLSGSYDFEFQTSDVYASYYTNDKATVVKYINDTKDEMAKLGFVYEHGLGYEDDENNVGYNYQFNPEMTYGNFKKAFAILVEIQNLAE